MANNSQDLHKRVHTLLNRAKNLQFYSEEAHNLITKEYISGVATTERSIMLPLHKDKWFPKKLCDKLYYYYFCAGLRWPNFSHYSYAMDYVTGHAPGLLYFGYAIEGEDVRPAAFFVTLLMTGIIDGHPGDFYPEEWVIDPMGIASGHKPDAYIGLLVPKQEECITNWVTTGGTLKSHPLEVYAKSHKSSRESDAEYWAEIMNLQAELMEGIPMNKREDAIKWLRQQ
ncbi:MAG: hypothetical protein AAB477_02725 [Patescibacteria group bacterium]